MALNDLFDTDDRYGSRHTFAAKAPGYVDARALAASSSEVHTVPSGARYVVFSPQADFWAKPDAAASVPSGDVTDGTASQLNPAVWNVEGVTTIGLISATAQTVSLTFYK